jgi:hypothetical protein
MKINRVETNNRKKYFEIVVGKRQFIFPYSKLSLKPDTRNKIAKVYVDKALGREAFTYILNSGEEDSVHFEQVLEFNEDPIYRLTLLLQSKLADSAVSKRQFAKLLGTSPAQIERLLDQTNYNKSIRQLFQALYLLDCRIDFVEVNEKDAA